MDTSKNLTADAQALSNLMNLPGEIRNLIYRYYIFDNDAVCHIQQHPQGRGTSSGLTVPSIYPSCSLAAPLSSNISALPLLLSCRQVYHEATAILYADGCFHFNDVCVLKIFLSSTTDIHANMIRSLRLDWVSFVWFDCGCRAVAGAYLREYWHPVCRRLANLPALHNLHISIRSSKVVTRGRDVCDMEYLEPLRQIKVPVFTLEL